MDNVQRVHDVTASAQLLLTPEEAATLLRVGRTTVYALMKAGDLRPVHIGRSCRISHAELERFVGRLGYALLDSPVALAAWLLDDITLYWLTGTGVSAARCYWEDWGVDAAQTRADLLRAAVAVPVGFTTFPGEVWPVPRSWVQTAYPSLTYFNWVDRGGHFAAWEEPQLFATEVQAAFRPPR